MAQDPAAHVALFRNLNLGHPGSPTGDELVAAFGGPDAASGFQTNGTVVFRAEDPASLARRARELLAEAGHRHDCVIRPLAEVRRIVEDAPPLPADSGVYRVVASFFDLPDDRALPEAGLTPIRSRDGLVEVSALTRRHARSLCWRPGSTAGNATAVLEKLLGVPVTTRTLGTLERLVSRHSG